MPTKFGFPEDAYASYETLSYELRRRGRNSRNPYLDARLARLADRLPRRRITGSEMEHLLEQAVQLANRHKTKMATLAICAFGEARLATIQ